LEIGRERLSDFRVFDQFDRLEETAAANIAGFRYSLHRLDQQFTEQWPFGSHLLHQLLPLNDPLYRHAGCASSCMPSKGMTGGDGTIAILNHLPDAAVIDRGAEWHIPSRQPFGDRHDIRHHTIMLEGTPGAAAATAAHDLVRNHHHAIAVADLAHARRIAPRCRHAAASRPDHGLEDEGSDAMRS